MRLLELLELAPPIERPGIHRRLGDLALFLTGVFPDHAGGGQLRLGAGSESPLALLERLGKNAYRSAWQATGSQGKGTAQVLEDLASDGFGRARRILNFLTDRYLFPLRDHWFPTAA